MMKQSHMNRPLYDKVRQDLFEEKKKSSLRIPSITTICLLQLQAFMVQLLSNLPSISADEKPCSVYQYISFSTRSMTKWTLLLVLFILDNIARLLNVESEIKDIITEDDDGYYSQKSDQCTKRNSSTNESGTSEPTTPNKRSSGHSMVSPSSPIHSPTPNFVLYPAPTTRSVKNSPVLAPSRVNHSNRARSSSFNNTSDKQQGQQQLRRSPGRREITVHNAILPIVQRKHHHHHHHSSSNSPDKKSNSTANSVTSRSSSESSTGRPRMQKTMSLSTAQQYHHHNESSLSNSTRTTRECLLTNRKDPLKGAVPPAHYHNTLPWKQ